MTNSNNMFSVVSVTLNAGDDLKATAASVLCQDFPDFEYVIKDGGSNDNSLKFLPDDRRLRVVVSRDDGIFDAMNEVLEYCRGAYIYFLNAGDVFVDAHVLEDVAVQIQKCPDVQFFYGDIINRGSKKRYMFHPPKLSRYYLYTNGLCHQAWFVSRALYVKYGGFDTMHKLGGDYLLLLKIILEDRVKSRHINRFIAVYKGGGLSANADLYKESEKWRQAARDRLYSGVESRLYPFIYSGRNMVKGLFYDGVLFPLVRKWYRLRYVLRRK